MALPAPTRGASDNTNLIQQILVIVQSIQAILVGTDGSVASLQSDVTAIKARTDNLPTDTQATLADIKNSVGSGPLNHMVMHSFPVSQGEAEQVSCSSSGPFLLHVHGRSLRDGVVSVEGGGVSYGEHPTSDNGPAHIVVGGEPGDLMTIRAAAADLSNPNNFTDVLITMQTTEGAVTACNPS